MKKDLTYTENLKNNLIVIVNAIPDGQMQTAKRLAENIQDHFNSIQTIGYCNYEKISTVEELRKIFETLEYYSVEKNAYPVLHIEAHGIKGIGLDICGETITWQEIHELSLRINTLTKNNFGLVLAGCYGQEIAETVDIKSPCPFQFVLGPSSEIKAGVIEDQTTQFYKEIIKTQDLNSALSYVEKEFVYFRSSIFVLAEISKFFARHIGGKQKDKLKEELLTRILKERPNNKSSRNFARARLNKLIRNPEKFIILTVSNFLHGNSPVSYEEIRDFYMQAKT